MLDLFYDPEDLVLWNDGWDHKKRPTLRKMFENLNERMGLAYPSVKGFTHDFNSATHGDPLSARWNVVLHDGVPVFLASKNLGSPELADEICAEAIPWLASAMGMMSAAFTPQDEGGMGTRPLDAAVH